jgi:exopolyphosphatase/guanosine-5'-triphosphate,3'-diphosphate pyrophosphatase
MRAGAIDIGTNTVLLTIAERGPGGVRALLERATITRLGERVDRTGSLSEAATARTLACLRTYSELLLQARVEALDVVGTSALRDAAGSQSFLDAAAHLLGKRPRVISGDEEAALTFFGAISGLDLEATVIVFDIGGGSTEIIVRSGAGELAAKSLDIGSVRLFERHLHADPPLPGEVEQVRRAVATALRDAPLPAAEATLVGVAGTITTLAAINQGLVAYDSARVHGAELERTAIEALLQRLAALPLDQRRNVTGLDPGRADVIVAGAAIAAEVVRWSGRSSLKVSDRGVRWGLIQRLLEH